MSNTTKNSGQMPEPNPRALEVYGDKTDRLIPLHSWRSGELAKVPLTRGWQNTDGFTFEQAQRHMAGNEGNIGFRAGGGWLIADVDPKNGGAESFETLRERFDVDPHDFLAVRTGLDEKSGKRGLHLYMRVEEANFECVFNLPNLPGIDFKYSGQVVAAGSVHSSGYLYEVAGEKTLATTAVAPQALLDAIRRPSRQTLAPDAANGFGEFTAEQIWPSLDQLPVDAFASNGAWLQLGMAVHHMSAGEALDIFLDWSARDPKYSHLRDENYRRLHNCWDNPIGFKKGTYFKALKDHNVPRELWPDYPEPPPPASEAWEDDQIDDETTALVEASEVLPAVKHEGRAAKGLDNCVNAIRALGIKFAKDDFVGRKSIGGHAIEAHAGQLSDDAITALRFMLLKEFGIEFSKDMVQDAAATLCLHGRYDSLMQHVDERPAWDGAPRLHRLVPDYLGAEDTPLNRAIGRLLLGGMMARARRPGCKFDTMPILEGPQGAGKSTAIRILAGDERYGEGQLFDLNEQRRAEALSGKWLYEVGELNGMSRREAGLVKMVITQQSDEVRMAYDRHPSLNPRRTILIGTTNNDRYLRDATGNRRFLPVKVGAIDLEGLRRDRDQLLAEAAAWDDARQRQREPFLDEDGNEWGREPVLPRQLWAAAAEQQGMRMEDDPWLDRLFTLRGFPGKSANGPVERISTEAAFSHLGVDGYRQDPAKGHRLRAAMERLGWTYSAIPIRIDGVNERGYFRPLSAPIDGAELSAEELDAELVGLV